MKVRKLDKRGEMQLRDFFYVLVFFGAIISGFYLFLGDVGTSYGQEIEGNYSAALESFRDISSAASNLSKEAEALGEEESGWEALASGAVILKSGIIEVIKMPFRITYAYFTIIGETMDLFSIPDWVQTALYSFIIITILFTVVKIFWRRLAV